MEDEGTLDSNNDADMYCLHYVAKDVLQQALDSFASSWNHHKISQKGQNLSPIMLFESGKLRTPIDNDEQAGDLDGIAEEMEEIEENISNHVLVEKFPCPLSPEQLDQLRNLIDPKSLSLDNLESAFIYTKNAVQILTADVGIQSWILIRRSFVYYFDRNRRNLCRILCGRNWGQVGG